jgi:Raf kinase inhibitor-like YbhB/YbcL family protein
VRRGGDGRRTSKVTGWLAGLLAGSLLLGGCGLFGKPKTLIADAPLTMSVTSPVFVNEEIPAQFTCHGTGAGGAASPPIFWSAPPPGTKSLALVVDDAAAPISPRVYWIVFDISPATTDLQVGALPPSARVAENSSGSAGYDAPCPKGRAHSYRFTVYALNTFFGKSLPPHPRLLPALIAIAPHVTARGTLTAWAQPGPASR